MRAQDGIQPLICCITCLEIKGLCAFPPVDSWLHYKGIWRRRGSSLAPRGAHPGTQCQPDLSLGILPETHAGSFYPKWFLFLELWAFAAPLVVLAPDKGDGKRLWPAEAEWRSVCRYSLMDLEFQTSFLKGSAMLHPDGHKAGLPCSVEWNLRVHRNPCPKFWNRPSAAPRSLTQPLGAASGILTFHLGWNTG